MKRNIFKIGLGLMVIMGLVSCESLDVKPKGFYSDENFYKTVEDANAGLLYAYDALTLVSYAPVSYYLGELASDNVGVKPDEGADAQQFDRWEVNSQNTLLLDYYRGAYISINRANAVIANTEGKGFNQEDEDRLLGESYFLRAYNHFNLVRAFGLVPLQKKLIDKLEDTNASLPADMQEVYTFLIEDLTKAVDLLKEKRVTGLADKVAAQALLAKVYLYAATSKESRVPKYDLLTASVDELYANAAKFANSVLVEQGTYSFDSDLHNIYDVNSPDGPEHIFIMSMDRSGTEEGDYSKIARYFLPALGGVNVYLKNTDDSYTLTLDGFGVFTTEDKLLNLYPIGDIRRDELMATEIYSYDEDNAEYVLAGSTDDDVVAYEFTRKYIDPEFSGEKTSTRPYLIRYSDVMMMYAEAAANQDGLNLLNQIRVRAGLEEFEASELSDKAAFRAKVIEERQRELAFEADRLWDLRRTNTVSKEVSQAAGLTPEELAFYPLPQREVDLNPNL
ncbi:RagB/SusD family nutrient uptake outer membrane protein [Saccharicrinis aurantiacus]|uniref:RagB/SusD family nutrient uptake outer membrane protein n=1 Tax=Saccharicrinis aurantiacus TaxID=1849719 RepID=UPI0024929713|nr:RagB/SusD family nutrient uptake outer membrane protein [Saccharicrinis aurantiacus]